MKKPAFNPHGLSGKRLLIEWTIKQWEEMHTPTEDELARDMSLIEFPANAIPMETRLNFAIATGDECTFEDLMRDKAGRDEVFRRLRPKPARGAGRPEGSKDLKTAADKSLKAWAFEVEKDILLIWANAFSDDPGCIAKDREEKPFALDIAVQILNSMGDYKLNAEDLRDYRSNRGTRSLPRE